MTTPNWVEEQERLALHKATDAGRQAQRMLERSETNRVVTAKQAKLLVAFRFMADNLASQGGDWSWMNRVADMLEDYQLTIGTPENSRKAFREALRTELMVSPSGDGKGA